MSAPVPTRVGLVTPLPPQMGGVVSVATWLLEHEGDVDVRYETFDLWRPEADEIGGRLRLSTLPRQVRLVRRYAAWLGEAPRIIHLCAAANPTALPRDIVFAALARARRKRVITHVHNGSDLERAATSWPRRAGLRLLARASHVVVAIAPTCERWLREIGVPAVHVLNPLGIQPASPPQRNPRGGIELLAVGAYGRAKGSFDLAEAVALARAAGVEVELSFVGKELRRGEHQQLAGLVRRLGLERTVSIDGVATRSQLARRYGRADVVCLPSHREGLPMIILEAMAFGLPVIATRVGAVADLVSDGETGLLVDPGDVPALADAIVRVARDGDLRARLATGGAKRIGEIAADADIAAAWSRIYAEAVGDEGPAGARR